jgi:gliding motility-associated-like protein
MRNFTSQKLRILFLIGFFLTCLSAIAQTPVAPGFSARLPGGSMRVKGDVLFVGNNILNRSPNPNTAYDGNTDNNGQTMEYIDIDGDSSTRNSSSANLTLTTCDRVVYAGLYWASTYPYERSTDNGQEWNPSDANRYSDFNQIKFKLPTGAYIDITGTTLFDGRAPVLNQSFKDAPAICYKDVTSLVQGLTTPTGTYTVANMRSSKGQRAGSSSAGWVMVIIYENPTLPSKFISTYDGYAGVTSGQVDIPISGFVTLPSPNPVNARLGVGALEGDKGLTNDRLQFKANLTAGWTDIGNTLNPTDNFFNSTITNNDAQVPGRNPYGQNTLGLDLDMLPINNPSNTVIKNNETGAILRLKSSGDGFGAFLATFAVDIIEPNIKLVKTVQNSSGVDITGQNVTLSSVLDYVITIDNEGNDDAKNVVIKDILPVNTTFDSLTMPTITAAGGSYTYNAATGTILINVPNSLVLKGTSSVPHTIKIRVRVASSCNELTDACSSIIRNSAFVTYQGVINTSTISDNPSAAGLTTCGAPLTGPANFLVDVSACVYSRTEVICNGSLVLTAADGYGTYAWFKENGAVDIPMGTTQTITVNDIGEYYYNATPIAPCIVPIKETVYVTDFLNSTMTNPVIPFADATPICPNNGTVLPKIYLCGSNDSQFIPTGINTGIVRWQKLNGTCATTIPVDCPHNACPASAWDTVFTGPNYTADTAGEYRILFDPNGTGACPMPFYFNVYKNNYDPQVSVKDKICTTNGEIRVLNAPANYQIKLINQTTNTVVVDYPNTNPVFPITAQGAYTVEIRQVGVPNGCIFRVTDITVLNRAMTATVTPTNKTCTVPGSISIQALNVSPQYTFTVTGPSTITHGPVVSNNHVFSGLNPGTYTVTVTTQDGCTYTTNTTVSDFSNPVLNAAVTQSPTNCDPGVITLTPSAGQAPYTYYVYSINGTVQTVTYFPENTYTVPVANVGTYIFAMTDANNCTVQSNAVTINNIIPVVTQSSVNPKCNGVNNGSITVSATGTGISYELLNSGGTVVATNTSGSFPNLAAGAYTVNVIQTGTTTTCSYPYTFTLTAPAAISGTASVTTPLTCNPAGATITAANAAGGTAPYQYSINGTTFVSSPIFTGLTAGTYSVTIRDANNCTFVTSSMTLTAPAPVTNITFSATAVTCPAQTSNVTLTAVGGVGPFTYAITSPTTVNNGTSATFASLAPGTYTFTVTDAKGCTFSKNYTINAITPISVVGQNINNVVCFGTATGTVRYTVSGFAPNYNYTVANSAGATTVAPGNAVTNGTVNLTNLAAGTYTITVTDPVTLCTATSAITITAPTAALTVSNTPTQPTCTTTTGSVTVNATGGWGSNSYSLAGPTPKAAQSSNSFTGLAAGNYTITVTDANGCAVTSTFTLTAAVRPVLTVTGSDVCLPGTSLTVAVTAGTGLAPFQFSLNGGTYANGTVANGTTYTNLAAGTYTITVRDANGCTNATTITRTINAQLTTTTSLTKGITCTAPTAAQIAVTIAGGGASYQYKVSYNGGAYSSATTVTGSFTYSAAAAGTYQFEITDAAGCVVTTPVRTVAPKVDPEFAFGTTTDVLCSGASTGALTVNIDNTKGAAPYTIAVTNTDTSTPYLTQTSGLPAGNYSVTVTDANGCTVTHTAIIDEPDPIAYSYIKTDISCNNPGGISYGQIEVASGGGVTGGTPPFTYTVSNNFGDVLPVITNNPGTSSVFLVVNYGIYSINVTDANGCSKITNGIVIASPPSDLEINVNSTADCTNGGTVTVEVDATVGSGTYKFAILTQSNLPFVGNVATDYKNPDSGTPEIATFTNLIPGVLYTFVVWDTTTDCYFFKEADVPIPTNSTIAATSIVPNNVTCFNAGDGNVSFTFGGYSGTTTQVKYEIFKSPSNLTTGISATIPTTGASTTVNSIPGNLIPGDYVIVFTEIDGSVAGCSKATSTFKITQSASMLVPSAAITKNDNCNTNAGIITASATFGTTPYSYQVLPAATAAPTEATWAGQASPIFNREGGNYIVYVKDANDCIKPFSITLPTDVSPAITAVITPGTQCTAAEGSFSIDVTRTAGNVGGYTYSLDGGIFEAQTAPFTYTGLTSGTHTIQIMDANGCTMATAASVTIYPPVNVTAQPTVQPACADADGEITAVGEGGSGNYEYELMGAATVAAQPGAVFTGLAHGAYTVRIHDTTTGCTADVAVTLEDAIEILPATVTNTHQDVTCASAANGSITVTVDTTVNTDIPYTYSINGGTAQASPQFTGLAGGTYNIVVTSGKGCTLPFSVIVDEPSALTVDSITATPFACNASNSVTTSLVEVTETTGTGTAPYMYSIDDVAYSTTNTFDIINNGSSQTITAYIRDANGCKVSGTVIIAPLPAITGFTPAQQTAITCTNDETVRVTVAGGSGNYEFTLLPSGPVVTPGAGVYFADFDLTAVGDYTFQVEDLGTTCTKITSVYTVAPYDLINVTATASTPVVCFGSSTGSVTIDVQGYTGAYTYEVFDGTTSIATATGNTSTNPFTISSLPAGNLFVTVTASATPFCLADTNSITVASPANALAPNATKTADVTCTNNLGEITAQATGGWGTYEYQLINNTTSVTGTYSTNNVFSGLAAGNYTVNVKDSGNCIVSQNIPLAIPSPLAATITPLSAALLCNGDTTATVQATAVSGGQGTYEYILNTYDATGTTIVSSTGAQASPVFTDLAAGIYTISVVDGWTCGPLETVKATITQPTPLMGNMSLTDQLSCTTGAQLTITATGGTAPYQFSTDNGTTYNPSNAPLGAYTVTIPVTGAGTYQYLVIDANGCAAVLTNEVEIPAVEPLNLNLDLAGAVIGCHDDATASLSADATGGLGGYMYTLLNAANNPIAGPVANGDFGGLTAGTYSVYVTSGDCNATSAPVTINNPVELQSTPLVTNILCYGQPTGSVAFTTTGGTGIKQYAISPNLNQFVNTNVFSQLVAGTYDFIVQDENGCFLLFTETITEPTRVEAEITVHSDEACLGAANGTIDVRIWGGTGAYSISTDNITYTNIPVPSPIPASGTQYQLTGLPSGMTTVYVKDANDCSLSPPLDQPILPGVNMAPVASVVTTCVANAPNNNVTISTTLSANATGVISYSIDGTTYQSSNVFNNVSLAAGTYTAYARHVITATGLTCIQTTPFTIDPHTAIAATPTITQTIDCFGDNGEITINVTAGAGTSPFEYAIGPLFTYDAPNVFSNLPAGTYDFKVRDDIGCEFNITGFVLGQPLAPLTATVTHTDEICLGANDGTITVTPADGTGPYRARINGGTYTSPASSSPITFSLLTPNTYTVDVIDANGCTFTLPAAVIIAPGVDLQASIAPVQLCDVTTITVTVNPAVAASITYYLDGAAQASNVITATGLTPGAHSIDVTHSNGCSANFSFNVAPVIPIVMGATSHTDVLCFAGTSGSATVTATGGTGAFTYAIAPNVLPLVYGTYQASNTFTGLSAGSYVINVKDALGCESPSATITIAQPAAALTATATDTDEICLAANDGTITVTPANGTGPYRARINGGAYTVASATPIVFSALAPGNYTVDVIDANGCTLTLPAAINIAPGVDLEPSAFIDSYCTSNVIENIVLILDDNANANLQYSLDGAAFRTDNDYYNVAPGVHTATIRHANGCTQSASFTVPTLLPISPSVTATTDVNCFGDATGAITVTATGGTGTLSYAIANASVLPLVFGTYQATGVFTGLTSGSYTVSVMDDNLGCETRINATIAQPAAALTATAGAQTNILCYGNATGSATVNVTGGTTAYSYSWNTTPVQTTATATGLTAGTYIVTVTDANLCTTTQSFTITQPAAALTATAGVQTNVLCYGNATGSATVNVTGGTTAYSYSWNTTPVQTTATATGLTAGTYIVTVTDANLCTTTQSFTITQPAAPLAATAGAQTNVLCFGNATGSATVNVTGGTTAYSYSWNTTPVQTTATATGLTAGTYIVTVTDANLCTTSQSFTITQPAAALTATAGAQTNVLCYGNATGSATVNVTGGTGAYTYSWNTTPVQTTATATGLSAGTYIVTVTDANLCTTTQSFTITQPAAPLAANAGVQTNVLCFGNATGSATVNVTGGTTVYSYSWNTTPVQTTATATGLSAGTYIITVTDANLCTTTQSFTITQPAAPLAATAGAQTNVLCYGNATGSATVNVTGGTTAYTYSWNTTPVQTTATATGLTAGTYIVTVTDANLCTTTQSFTITQPAAPLSATTGSTQTNVLCFGGSTATATVNATGGTVPYTYSWNTTPVQTTATATGLAAGTYTVTVTDANGCTTTQSFTITQPATALTAAAGTQTNVLCFGAATGSATIVVTGGTGTYTYSWNTIPVQTTATATGLTAGNYQATVTDANGCTAIANFTISQPATAVSATATHTNELCLNAGNGTITVTPTGGTAPYEARINGGAYSAPSATTIVFSALTPGNYAIDVRDANGCTITVPTSITVTPGVNLQPSIAANQVCNVTTITVTVNPAVAANVTYTLDGGTPQASNVFVATGLTVGSHSIVVAHSNGCNSAPLTFNVAPVIPIVVGATSHTDVLCFAGATGTATVTATGGTAPLSYAIAPNVLPLVYGTYQASNTFTSLAAGDYVINVKDALGCESASTVINIAQPVAALAATATHTNELCLNAGNGTITVTPAGGAAPYEARINGGAYSAPSATTIVFSALTPGNYAIDVRDANGCTFTVPTSITVTPGVNLQPSIVANQVCNVTTITVTVNAAVAANVTYALDGGTPQASNVFVATGLTAGSHSIVVAHSNGCNSAPLTFNVAPVIPIVVGATTHTDVLCFAGATGTATVTATGGTAPLSYAIAPNVLPLVYGTYQASNTFTSLAAGDYVINVKDALGCESATTVINIAQPVMAVSATIAHTDEQCLNDNNGSITVTPQGGTAPYSASINGGAFTAPSAAPIVFNGLGGGTYAIQVRDANGCIFNAPSTAVLTGIVIGASVNTTQVCDQVTIVVSVNASVAGSVMYSLDGGTPQASNTFVATLNPAVPHSVAVQHVQGCTEAVPFTVAPIVPINLTAANVNVTNIACHGQDVGSIAVNATGGTGPLQYAITWGIWPTPFYGPSNTFNDLLANTNEGYTIWVKDAMGCVVTYNTQITEPAQQLIIAAAVGQHESCVNAHDGAIDITLVQGGTPPYSIALDSPNNFQPYNPAATPDFGGLYGRTLPYDVYVRDANGCYAKAVVTIEKGVNLVPNIQTMYSCVNNVPVTTITATLNTIINNVEYRLVTSTGTLIQDFDPNKTWDLQPGNYVYTVRHINGCQKDFAFTVYPRVPVAVTSVLLTDTACNGGTDGTLTVAATGGTGNLTYGISPDFIMTSNPVFTGLAAGTYTVRVQDQYGCFTEFSAFPAIGEPSLITVTDVMNLPETCVDDNDAAFEIDIQGGVAPYATSLNANGPFVADQTLFDNLDGGTYTVYVQDANGCTTTHEVILVSPLDIDAKAEVVYNCDQNTITIVTNNAVNQTELSYTITGPKNGTQTSNVFSNLEDGDYTVEVLNTVTGCTDDVAFTITSVPDLALSLTVSGLNQIQANVAGGAGPYQYTFDGTGMGTKNTFVYNRSGIYEVTVTDSRGCTRVASIEVEFIDVILPDVVSPDGDGNNDTWSPGNTTNYPNINSEIFDRYGRKLATLRQGESWDGTYEGNNMPTGDYWYLVKLGDDADRSFVGHFTIYR